jgi:hypothetical protein
MSLSQETLLELMALADGELGEDDRSRVEQLVLENDEARRAVEAMRSPALGAYFESFADEHAVAADGIADAVMAKVGAGADADVGASVSAGSGGNARGSASVSAGAGRAGARVVPLADAGARKRSRVQVVSVTAAAIVALAAGVVVYVGSSRSGVGSEAPVASMGTPSVDVQPSPSALAAQRPTQGVEVDEVDSPSREFSVFEIPIGGGGGSAAANAAGPSSVVIMIDDDPGAK